MALRPPPSGGEEDRGNLAGPPDPRFRGRGWLLLAAMILFVPVAVGGWALGLYFAVKDTFRGLHHADVDVFMSAWLAIWVVVPIWGFRAAWVELSGRARPAAEDPAEVAPVQRAGVVDASPHRDPRQFVSPGGLFLVCWLIAWVAAGFGLLRQGNVGAFIVISLIAVGVAALVADGVFGRVTVFVAPTALELRHAVGPIGRTRRYDLSRIRDLRTVPVETEDGPSEVHFEVAFQVGRKTVRFGRELSRAEADAIVAELAHYVHVGTPPERERARSPRWVGWLVAALVVGAVLFGARAVDLLKDTVGRRPQPTRSAEVPARSDAAAQTRSVIEAGGVTTVLGKPTCDPRSSTVAWSCTVSARDSSGPYAGRARTWRCHTAPSVPPGSTVYCGPELPSPVPSMANR